MARVTDRAARASDRASSGDPDAAEWLRGVDDQVDDEVRRQPGGAAGRGRTRGPPNRDLFGLAPLDMDQGMPAMSREPTEVRAEAIQPTTEENEIGRIFGVQSSGTPNDRSTSGEAGGAVETVYRSPPSTQPLSGPRQDSAHSSLPSVTDRSSVPPSRTGGVTTLFDESLQTTPEGRHRVQVTSDLDELLDTAQELVQPYRDVLRQAQRDGPGAKLYGARVKKRKRLGEKMGAVTPLRIPSGTIWVAGCSWTPSRMATRRSHRSSGRGGDARRGGRNPMTTSCGTPDRAGTGPAMCSSWIRRGASRWNSSSSRRSWARSRARRTRLPPHAWG